MSLDKAIEHGKERRKPYRRSKRFDTTCRNHGACGRCRDDRTHAGRKAELAVLADQTEIAADTTLSDDPDAPASNA